MVSSAPVIAGVFNRLTPPFWPPSQVAGLVQADALVGFAPSEDASRTVVLFSDPNTRTVRV